MKTSPAVDRTNMPVKAYSMNVLNGPEPMNELLRKVVDRRDDTDTESVHTVVLYHDKDTKPEKEYVFKITKKQCVLLVLFFIFLSGCIVLGTLYGLCHSNSQERRDRPQSEPRTQKPRETCLPCSNLDLSSVSNRPNSYNKRLSKTGIELCCVDEEDQLHKLLQCVRERKGISTGLPQVNEDVLAKEVRPTALDSRKGGPAAHLSLRSPVNRHTRKLKEHRLTDWISSSSQRNAFLDQVTIDGGQLVIPRTGRYYVYSQIYFTKDPRDERRQGYSQYIYVGSPRFPLKTKKVLTNTECHCSSGQVKANYMGAVLNLRQGDKLSLYVNSLTITNVKEGNFFGLYFIGN